MNYTAVPLITMEGDSCLRQLPEQRIERNAANKSDFAPNAFACTRCLPRRQRKAPTPKKLSGIQQHAKAGLTAHSYLRRMFQSQICAIEGLVTPRPQHVDKPVRAIEGPGGFCSLPRKGEN